MAKKRKPATKPASRRSTRRGKQANTETIPVEGETSTSVETSLEPQANDKPPETTSTISTDDSITVNMQTSQSQNLKTELIASSPAVALHKKFGKYRCLFNNDDNSSRKIELGSDSETNSSIEIKVVDPCASSESDSNAVDAQSDTNSTACPSPMNNISNTTQSLNSVSQLIENKKSLEVFSQKANAADSSTKAKLIDEIESENEEMVNKSKVQNIPLVEQIEYTCDEDEVITVVQIVEDDNQDLYYNINIDSPKDDLHMQQTSCNEELENKTYNSDFQTHFANLNLASQGLTPMHCSEITYSHSSQYNTTEMFSKDNSNDLARPDPSLTPSSTLSDDSNCSRVTEQAQNNSNDSAESSPTGVRRSSRIKTISNLKQKTKGYGLVKTPLKKALITQTKLKLEELSSDNQEKLGEVTTNIASNSAQFPIPSEMPVKVKSRWRRSSELEMGTNSPAISPLASPGLPQRLLPPVDEQNPTDEENSVTELTKEAYDKIIDERMNQFQHLDENEYLCDRMISKDTKKMICDCFITKEELERGELACGEDCLNRLLMIEWLDLIKYLVNILITT